MGIFSWLRSQSDADRHFSYLEAAKKYGLMQLAQIMAIIVRAKFSLNAAERAGQVSQFLREEADAMAQAGGYAAQFVNKLFDDESAYSGALEEEAEFPVDYPGGPQQTLLRMTLDFMRETGCESELATRFRCFVVGIIAEIELMQVAMIAKPDCFDRAKALELKRKVEEADQILGEFMKSHGSYFRQFMKPTGG